VFGVTGVAQLATHLHTLERAAVVVVLKQKLLDGQAFCFGIVLNKSKPNHHVLELIGLQLGGPIGSLVSHRHLGVLSRLHVDFEVVATSLCHFFKLEEHNLKTAKAKGKPLWDPRDISLRRFQLLDNGIIDSSGLRILRSYAAFNRP
jgi:hypothetical protein